MADYFVFDKVKEWKILEKDNPEIYKKNGKKPKFKVVWLKRIIGVQSNTQQYIHNRRIEDLQEIFKNKEYKFDKSDPIHLVKLKEKYYIGSDGKHRVLSAKKCGIKKLKALVQDLT
ncbi:MAG: hypothetical protein PHH82_04900 [Candidatus ainarchaeum sp.]|nr:hypothetical protein [Candidatus ainarchaeum sp.]